MSWVLITIFAYFLFAITAIIDKYLISGPIPNPKVYVFYMGVLSIFVLLLVPFGFSIPEPLILLLALLAGAIRIFGSFGFFSALALFETSRVVPAIGGVLPIFTFLLTYFFSGGKEVFNPLEILAFISLVAGTVLISLEKRKSITLKSLQISVLTAFLISLSFLLSKFVYLNQPFWSGFIWIMMGSFLMSFYFFFSKEVKKELFQTKISFKPKTAKIFLTNQVMGASAFILQNWAIALVPLGFLAFVNALEGTKYVFLLIFTILLSLKLPQILKEEISRKILFQKIIAILLIGLGLSLIAF